MRADRAGGNGRRESGTLGDRGGTSRGERSQGRFRPAPARDARAGETVELEGNR